VSVLTVRAIRDRLTWLDPDIERDRRIARILNLDMMRTHLEIQVLEDAVVVVDDPGIVAIDEYLSVRRCVDDAEGTIQSTRSDRVVTIPATVPGVAICTVRLAEIQVEAPARTIAVRTISERGYVDAIARIAVRRDIRAAAVGPVIRAVVIRPVTVRSVAIVVRPVVIRPVTVRLVPIVVRPVVIRPVAIGTIRLNGTRNHDVRSRPTAVVATGLGAFHATLWLGAFHTTLWLGPFRSVSGYGAFAATAVSASPFAATSTLGK